MGDLRNAAFDMHTQLSEDEALASGKLLIIDKHELSSRCASRFLKGEMATLS